VAFFNDGFNGLTDFFERMEWVDEARGVFIGIEKI
jgi:hypothetical protein